MGPLRIVFCFMFACCGARASDARRGDVYLLSALHAPIEVRENLEGHHLETIRCHANLLQNRSSLVGFLGKLAVDDRVRKAVSVLPARADVVVPFKLPVIASQSNRLEILDDAIRDHPAEHVLAMHATDDLLVNINCVKKEGQIAMRNLRVKEVNRIDDIFTELIGQIVLVSYPKVLHSTCSFLSRTRIE